MVLDFLNYLHFNQSQTGMPIALSFSDEVLKKLLLDADPLHYDEVLYGEAIPEWRLFVNNLYQPLSPIWQEHQILSRLKEIAIPTYHISGMAEDGDMPDVVRNFMEVDRNSTSRRLHHLILGDWNHGNSTPEADGSNLAPFMKERFDPLLAYYLKGQPTPFAKEPRVQVASNLSSEFIGSDTFPLNVSKKRTYYFNQIGNQYSLDDLEASTSDRSNYRYIPEQANDLQNAGQNLVFSTKITDPLPVLGSIQFDMYFEITSPTTDIFVMPWRKDAHGKDLSFTDCVIGSNVTRESNEGEEVMHVQIQSCQIMT